MCKNNNDREFAKKWFRAWRAASKRGGNPFRSEEVRAVY